MKRISCFVCLLALLLSACSVEPQTLTSSEKNYSYGIYELIFQETLLSNNFVGNDWSFTYTHNGQTIRSGYIFTQALEVFTFQPIDVEIREKDKYDDVASGTLNVAICEVGSGRMEITVMENAGVFKGNTAFWEISCAVKLIGKQ